LQVVATNSAGPDYSAPEIVEQDGSPIPPATIETVNDPVRLGKLVQFKVDWAGNWNNYDFDCGGSGQNRSFYVPKGQPATCEYGYTGEVIGRATLYYQNNLKTEVEKLIVVLPRQPLYLPVVRS
jgi:hypothetical protein